MDMKAALFASISAVLSILVFFVVCKAESISESNSKKDFMSLRQALFTDFNPGLRPVLNRSCPIIVNVTLLVFNIQALDERQQKLTISAWFYLEWMDEFLTWNASKHNGLTDIILPKDDVWTPDLKIFNGYDGLVEISDYGNLIRLSSDGAVIFEPGSAFELYCLVDITYYPFDRQSCSIVIMFWMSRVTEADMRMSNPNYVFRALRPNGEWDITFSGVKHYAKGFSDDPNRRYAYLEYTLQLTRKRTFYVLHYLIPVTLLSLLNAVVFVLPPESGEKMSLSITVLLSFTLFISLLNSSLPQTSLDVSLFAVYLSVLLGIGTVSVILSAVGLYLHYRQEEEKPGPTILPHTASVRRAIFRREPAQRFSNNSAPPEVGSQKDEYIGLMSRGEKQRFKDKQERYGSSFPEEGYDQEDTNNSFMNGTMITKDLVSKNTQLTSKRTVKTFWCINPNLFDRIGFVVSLFMTLGASFTVIILLASH